MITCDNKNIIFGCQHNYLTTNHTNQFKNIIFAKNQFFEFRKFHNITANWKEKKQTLQTRNSDCNNLCCNWRFCYDSINSNYYGFQK